MELGKDNKKRGSTAHLSRNVLKNLYGAHEAAVFTLERVHVQ